MFTYLLLLVGLRLAFDARRFLNKYLQTIERDENGDIKIRSPLALWYIKWWQKTKALAKHVIKLRKLEKEQKLNKISPFKKRILKRKKEKEAEKAAELEKYSSKGQLSTVAYVLKKYEEFVRIDLTLLIKKANSIVGNLRQRIINEKGFDVKLCASEFKEIVMVHQRYGQEIEKCSDKFYEYKKVVLELRPISVEQHAIESRLTKIINELKTREKMMDLSHNRDFKFVENYLKEQKLLDRNKQL